MQVNVGNTVKLGDRVLTVSRIDHHQTVRVAPESSRVMDDSLAIQTNCKWMDRRIEEFEEGDIIEMDIESAELVGDRHIMFIYTKYHVRKYNNANTSGVESSTGTPRNHEVEGAR